MLGTRYADPDPDPVRATDTIVYDSVADPDPDPYQNVMDPQHWFIISTVLLLGPVAYPGGMHRMHMHPPNPPPVHPPSGHVHPPPFPA